MQNTATRRFSHSSASLARLRERRAIPLRPAPHSAGDLAIKALRKEIAKAGPSSTRLEAGWVEIVGEKIARLTRPGKVTTGPRGRELTVHVLPAAAVIVEHQSELIRQRVSVAAGGDIVGIKLKQGPLSTTARSQPKPKQQVTRLPLSPEAKAKITAAAGQIENPRLRAAIVALGEAMLTEEG